jgi:SAM-dependent methyltransferase
LSATFFISLDLFAPLSLIESNSMHETVKKSDAVSSRVTLSTKDYLRRLLCPFWLRPESALWYAHEAFLARGYLGPRLRQPSLEFGCMEGTPTFVLLGGEFGMEFDVYSEVAWQHDSMIWKPGDDYYNISRSDRDSAMDITKAPDEKFEFGLSWKRAHLDKARRLSIHEQLIEHDPNLALTMFEDRSLATIWAPNLYWVQNLDGTLEEFRRVLSDDGRLVTVLPDSSALDYMLYNFADETNPEWIKDLDRGRHANISKQARSTAQWEEFFASKGLAILRHERFLPKVVFQFSDIGFRPMFPVFMHIYEALLQESREEWLNVKNHWIETAFHFLAPLCETEWMERMQMAKVWHIFELQGA